MPYVNLQITRGATRAQEEAIVREFTEVLVRVLHKRPEHTHVVIHAGGQGRPGVATTLSARVGMRLAYLLYH